MLSPRPQTQMLSLSTRDKYYTLLDALILKADVRPSDMAQDAIIYVETDRPAVHISREHFRLTIRAYAAGLRNLGIGPGDLVVIAHTQNLESIYAFWAALLVGAIPSMFPTLTEKLDAGIYMGNMSELVNLSGVSAVLTTDEFAPELATAVPCPVIGSQVLAGFINSGDGDNQIAYRPDPDDIAFLQHSSGSTGLQKGVALSHRAVLNQLASYGDALHLNERDVVVSWLPLYHDMGLIAGFMLPLVQGLPLVLMSPFDWVQHPALLFRAIHDHQCTLCWLPNFAYNHCARRIRQRDTEKLSVASMRLFINCSEPVYDESHQLFLERFVAQGLRKRMLSVSYAMAENTFAVTQTPAGEQIKLDIINDHELLIQRRALPIPAGHPKATTKVSCGRPITGTALQVVDEDHRPLPDRRVGEISVQSDCMLSEYYRRPDLEPFRDGWYLTGDMGYMADGEVYIVGRSKDLIINAGKNIYPQDIEAIVNQVPGVHAGRVVAFGVPDEREGTELIAVVAEAADSVILDDPSQRQALVKAIRQEVSGQSMVHVSYVQLVGSKWLIKTSSGKIARAANRDKWLESKAG